jgi:hypothetical protein
MFRPCHVAYHPHCLRIGSPFTTRLEDDKGLFCVPETARYRGFICEACRVRSVLKRELQRTPSDVTLLMLERATIVDIYNHWSHGTLKAYKSKLNVIEDFERDFDLPVLPRPSMQCPPHSDSRPLMWAQERYSLYPAQWRRSAAAPEATVKWGTIRALRSAAALQSTFNLLQSIPAQVTFGFRDKPTVVPACNPTDELGYTIFSDGMKRRIGDKSFPSAVLLDQHVTWMNLHYHQVLEASTDIAVKLETCRAAIANLVGWLLWLRAVETFTLRWKGITTTLPADGPSEGLPVGMGVLQLDLQAQTKSSQSRTADMVVAYATASGKDLGWWLAHLWLTLPQSRRILTAYVICHDSGLPWTSHYYRYTHVYPLLAVQRTLGDAYLAKFDETVGKGLIENYWSFNMYRRGDRNHVSRQRASNIRAATPAEVIEHGRWRISRSTLDMPTSYLEWSVADRSAITYFCM